jgi:hypothetical protein
MLANPRPAFDVEEHSEKLAETYEEMAVGLIDVSQVLIKLAPPMTNDSIATTMVGILAPQSASCQPRFPRRTFHDLRN